MATEPTDTTRLTSDEWKAIALLRTAANVGLQREIYGVPGSVVRAVEVANRLLDRTREETNNART